MSGTKSLFRLTVRAEYYNTISEQAEMGRGLGTYSMKLHGEDFLGGKVDFISAEKEGTVFRFSLKTRVSPLNDTYKPDMEIPPQRRLFHYYPP
jgi:hypothetical protein